VWHRRNFVTMLSIEAELQGELSSPGAVVNVCKGLTYRILGIIIVLAQMYAKHPFTDLFLTSKCLLFISVAAVFIIYIFIYLFIYCNEGLTSL